MITGEPRAASIRAASRTQCLTFDQDDFPRSSVLSGQSSEVEEEEEIENMNEKYGVTLENIARMNEEQFLATLKANQVRGSANSPGPIAGVDTDDEIMDEPKIGVEAEVIVPLLMRFKLIRLVTRCFDYIVSNRLQIGDEGARRRRSMLVDLISPSQHVEFTDAFNLIDRDGDGEITLMELRRLMDSIGEERSDEELLNLIATSHQEMDGKKTISYKDFIGIMAEAEFYNLFLETFRALDKMDTGYVRAADLDRVLCGVRDLITDDRNSIIDVEDTDMSIDYEQFSRMLLGSALM